MEQSRQFIIWWNNKYLFDYWWRKKYSIPFMSEAHLDADPIDILYEFIEHSMMNELSKKPKVDDTEKEPYIAGSKSIFRQFKQTVEPTKAEQKKIDNITSLDDLNFDENGKITLK